MPWEEKRLESMREEFVERVLKGEKSKAALCREYGISRPTGDKWMARYRAGETMCDHSRAPGRQANRIPMETEAQIVAYRKQYPVIGAVKLKRMLENEGYEALPCAKTFNNVLKRNGLITREASMASTPCTRFEKERPNEMWQSDFKGHFALGDNGRCHPLNIIDDYSRFNLCSDALRTETFLDVKPVMVRLFEEYGLPRTFLCDNGNPWGTAQSTGYSQFEVWLMELGVLTVHGRMHHPQTQGKEESFNRSLNRECLKWRTFRDMRDAQKQLDEYRAFYNNKRPHHALGLVVPATRYKKSERRLPKRIEPWSYAAECKVRRVKGTGYVTINGQGYFLSEAFGGKEIAVRESHLPGQITLLYRQFRIGRIDVERRVFTLKRAYLLDGDPRTNAPRGAHE